MVHQLLLLGFLAAHRQLRAQVSVPIDTRPDTWPATDGLGRAVPAAFGEEKLRSQKTVGIFYFLANQAHGRPLYNITTILAANPLHPAYGPMHTGHWWGEPWEGYYQSSDPAVIRKHMQMLNDAGVDVLVFDTTNGPTYPDVYVPLCKVLTEMRAQGNRTPQIAFFTGNNSWNTLYRDFYGAQMYKDLWFQWKGKPLMMVHLESGQKLPDSISSYFSVRESWAWTPSAWFGDGRDKWPWLDNYPQSYGWDEDSKKPEEISVSVAQHATSSIGRSSLSQREPPLDDYRLSPDTPKGLCFAQQFERALQVDPEFIFVTGWNDWTAGEYPLAADELFAGKPGKTNDPMFVDEYNAEFSRDIEPAKGLLQDDYYYQFVNFVRRYKGSRTTPSVTRKTVSLSKGFPQWNDVQPEFLDDVGDPVHRDYTGWANIQYTNDTGRNDIVAAKVAYDDKKVYFYVRTKDPLTPSTDPNWMLLFLDVDANPKTGWLGYDFVLNRSVGSRSTSLERNVGNQYTWSRTGSVDYRVSGNELMIAVPRAALGLGPGPHTIDFKWADNIQQTGDASDFTLNGDAAPNDRFNYPAKIDQ
jgi:hypothetical protein